MKLKNMVLALVLFLLVGVSYASNMFSGSVTVTKPGGATVSHSFSYGSLFAALESVSGHELRRIFGASTIDTATLISGQFDLRGLPATITLTGEGTSNEVIHFSVSGVINKVFTSNSSAAASTQLKRWFMGQGASDIAKLLKGMVSKTAFDPVGGNPSSLMARMVSEAFTSGDTPLPMHPLTHSVDIFMAAPTYENYGVGTHTVEVLGLPVSYTHYFRSGRAALIWNMPVYITRNDKSHTYLAGFGVGLKYGINKIWSVTPSVYLAGTGSKDLGAAAIVYAGNLKSRVVYQATHSWLLGMSNMVSYLHTHKLSVSGYTIDYGLENWALKNGVDATYQFNHSTYALSFFARNTHFFGSRWFIDHYTSLGIGLLQQKKNQQVGVNHLGLWVSYLFGPHQFQGLNVVLNWRF